MLQLFVPPTSFEGYGEPPYDETALSEFLAGLTVILSLGALTLGLYHVLSMLLFGEPLGGFGPPPSQHLMLSM
jgi:hypothetical protein